jgi:hypothetical protein
VIIPDIVRVVAATGVAGEATTKREANTLTAEMAIRLLEKIVVIVSAPVRQ